MGSPASRMIIETFVHLRAGGLTAQAGEESSGALGGADGDGGLDVVEVGSLHRGDGEDDPADGSVTEKRGQTRMALT
jgi:hypothetical protein